MPITAGAQQRVRGDTDIAADVIRSRFSNQPPLAGPRVVADFQPPCQCTRTR